MVKSPEEPSRNLNQEYYSATDFIAKANAWREVFQRTKNFDADLTRKNWDVESLADQLNQFTENNNIPGIYGIWYIATDLANRYDGIVLYELLSDDAKMIFAETRDAYKNLAMIAAARGHIQSDRMFSGNPQLKA